MLLDVFCNSIAGPQTIMSFIIDTPNYAVFRDCFSSSVLQMIKRTSSPPPRRRPGKDRRNAAGSKRRKPMHRNVDAAEDIEGDLAEFLDVCIV